MGESRGIPFANLADFPSVLHPEGLRFLGVLQGWFAHWLNHIASNPRMQEIRISRTTIIWITKLILLGPVRMVTEWMGRRALANQRRSEVNWNGVSQYPLMNPSNDPKSNEYRSRSTNPQYLICLQARPLAITRDQGRNR